MRYGALVLLFCGTALEAQSPSTGTIAGRIVARDGGHPLPYSMVALPDLGRERFTDDSGTFVLGTLPPGQLLLRVRRLGYAPLEVNVMVREDVTDTIDVTLDPIAVRLAAVDVRDVREYPPCREPGAPDPRKDSVLALVFEQLRMNAEQYRTLSEAYPFAYEMKVTIARETRSGATRVRFTDQVREVSTERRRYSPGRVVTPARARMRRFGAYEFNVPELPDFADEEFVRTHCFHDGRPVGGDERLIRIEVRAAERLRDPDVDGSILLDASTFQVRRTSLRMSRVPRWSDLATMTGQEVTTEFRAMLPSVPVVDRVHSIQRFDPRSPDVTYVAVHETQQLVKFEFLGRRPGEEKKP